MRSSSLRRGPTLRGGRSNRNRENFRQRKSDEEEAVGLFENLDSNEKLEAEDKPTYHHGDETFGDIIRHPVTELHAHQSRKQDFKSRVERWSIRNVGQQQQQREERIEYILILHFKQLRGNQNFALDHDVAEDFCKKLNFTQQEKLQFNGIHDTDGLTELLYKIKRQFSIKIHHNKNIEPHHTNNPIIEFNSNFFVEFKPKHHIQLHSLSSNRRPFFRHPEPDLSADIGEEEKAASWLELFYDLFFVASLTQFTHSHHIKDRDTLGVYAQWFIITWWAWCASSLYTARFDTDDVVHHIYKLTEMCAVIYMAGSSEYFLESPGYVYGYITLKSVLVIEYFIVFIVAILAKSKSRIALAFYVSANLLSIALWASSLNILEKQTHRILWFLGLGCEILVNVIVRGDKSLSWAASHLAERLGLLTLIVLGENLIGLVTLVAKSEAYLIVVIPNFLAVIVIFGFFFMYFEDFNKEIFLHNKYHQIWVYLHFPLHLCQIAFGMSLIDILKIHKLQLIQDHKIPAETTESSSGHGESTTNNSTSHGETNSTNTSHGETTNTNTSHGETTNTNTSHGETTSTGTSHGGATTTTSSSHSATTSEAVHNIKRDIFAIVQPNGSEEYYNPMNMQTIKQQEPTTNNYNSQYWTTWCQSVLASIFIGTVQMMQPSIDQESTHHHLQRRSPAAEGSDGSVDEMTLDEMSFVYKSFLIFAGLILVLNSLIKALNTKLSDSAGKIIIGSRIINAIILWSMCAIPFANLDAIVLLGTLTGSLVLQGLVDLLD